jgi:hypothetical protein
MDIIKNHLAFKKDQNISFKLKVLTHEHILLLRPNIGKEFDKVFADYLKYKDTLGNEKLLYQTRDEFLESFLDSCSNLIELLSNNRNTLLVLERVTMKEEILKFFNVIFTQIHEVNKEIETIKDLTRLKNNSIDYFIYLVDLTLFAKKQTGTLNF